MTGDATSSAEGVRIEVADGVARAILCRPDRLNPLDDAVRRALKALLDDLEERSDVRVLVVAGEGRAFSAGADLRATAYPPLEGDWSERRLRTGTWQRLLERFDRIPQATVAVLHGHVVGGAALLAAACDLRIAAESAVVRIPELALGIPLTWAGLPLLVREVGLPLARDWVMTGRPVAAEELLRSGFAQRLAPDDQLAPAADAAVAELLAMPPAALFMTRAMTAALGRSAPGMVAGWGDADLQQWAFGEDEYRAAVRAYGDRLRARRADRPPADGGG